MYTLVCISQSKCLGPSLRQILSFPSSVRNFFVKRDLTESEWDRVPVCTTHTLWVGTQGPKSWPRENSDHLSVQVTHPGGSDRGGLSGPFHPLSFIFLRPETVYLDCGVGSDQRLTLPLLESEYKDDFPDVSGVFRRKSGTLWSKRYRRGNQSSMSDSCLNKTGEDLWVTIYSKGVRRPEAVY